MQNTMLKFVFLYWIIPWFPALGDDNGDIRLFDDNEPRSRLVMINGHMYFHAGHDKNISFVTNGAGSIFVGNTDVSHLPDLASHLALKASVEELSDSHGIQKARLDSSNRILFAVANISRNIIAVTRNISQDVKMLREWKKDRNQKDVKLRKYLTKIAKGFKALLETLKMDGCDSKPCEAGGTCIPRLSKAVFCLCPPHRTGEKCEFDLNECELYEGDRACQNNATCENIENGFLCHCPSGFHGPLCQFKHSSCRRNPGVCGHGHCIESYEQEADSDDYKCICDPGYKVGGDKENPVCVDVNECLSKPCHPGVDCINLPGSFQCSGCPKGFHGNGQQCADIDECSQPNYPCSSSPRAQCFNTVGSYHCGPCPTGYRGDGRTCTRHSACTARPCHPLASCKDDVDNINAGGFVCHCPEGHLGDGIGASGCRKGNATVCNMDGRCLNGGTCRAVTEDSYLCLCPDGYFGSRCEKVSECISTPCKNGATCQYDVTNGYSCICAAGFYGQDCELEEDSCGKHFTAREGNLTFPDNFDLSAGKICDIVISSQADNEALRVTFEAFGDMESTLNGVTNCETASGNLTLYDGDNENANVFAVFCGASSSSKAPIIGHPITMTGSRAMFRYRGTKGKFSVKWELKKRDCGYRTSVPSGSLVIPAHYQNFSCEWFLSANPTQVVEITIPPVKMGTEERNCSVNQLEIYDGYTAYSSHRVIHFCSSVNETVTVRSTGPFLSVFFTNDLLYGSEEKLAGFQMNYQFVQPDHSCGGTFKNSDSSWDFSGEITTPNWGGLYPPDSHCTWLLEGVPETENVTAVASHALKLEFLEFDVPSPFLFSFDRGSLSFIRSSISLRGRRPVYRSLIKCTQDHLHIFVDGSLIYDACNNHRPPPSLLIQEGRAVVQFRSDAKTQGKGFKMQYSLVCEKRLTGNGTIQTWNYPDGGSKGKCTYVITADATHAIMLRIKYIGLRVATVSECFYSRQISEDNEDYVKLSGGKEDDKFLNQKYICAKYPFVEEGEFVVSASKPLTIEYSSSGHENNKGLLMEYWTVDVGCGGFFSMSNGVINSPSYPEKYLPHMHCVYQITVPWSKQVRLNFDNFDLEVVQNDDCNYDHVEIYDRYISPTNHGKLLGRFCGAMKPPSILSGTYTMAVVFVSDRSVAGNGFSARFESVDETIDCDRTFTAPTGEIIFDGSKGRYAECIFQIALPHSNKILLNINNMTLPCYKGTLQIKNGASSHAPGFGHLWRESEVCNDYRLQTTLRSHGNRMYLKLLMNDPSKIYLNISYESISQNCGGRVTGVSGTLATPQYPEKDSRPLDCEWTVAVAPGNKVYFQLANVDDLKSSDENGFCGLFASNRIDVLDGPEEDAPLLRRFCKKTFGSEPIVSEDHEILVKYRQQGGAQVGALYGFMAHFSTSCQNILHTAHTGTIQSPGFPDPVYTNQFCSWTITVPAGNRVRVTFLEYKMDQVVNYRSNCENYLKFGEDEVAEARIMQGNSINVTNSLVETCEKNVPIEVMSVNNSLRIIYNTKKKEENRFWLIWTTVGCGGDIVNPENVTVKEQSLNPRSDMFECEWKIKAPIGKKIQIRVKELLIFKPNSVSCEYNDASFSGVYTYAGLTNESGIAQDKLCAATKEGVVFNSHSNEMLLKLRVQQKHIATRASENFFNAEITFLDTNPTDTDDCGGVIDVPLDSNRTVHSPRFPQEYPKDAHCQWLFKAAPGQHLKFILKEFKTPNSHPQNTGVKSWAYSFSNLTCKHPMQIIEGAVTVYKGNTTRSSVIERICQDVKEPKRIDVSTQQSLVTFIGASAPRTYQSGESEKDKRIGFVLEAYSECGGLQLATSEEQLLKLLDMPMGICNISIRKENPDDSGIYIRLDEFFLQNQISQWHRRSSEMAIDSIEIKIDGGESIVRPLSLAMMVGSHPHSHEEFRAQNEIQLIVAKRSSLLAPQITIAFSTDIESCGSPLTNRYGTVNSGKLAEDTECIWTIKNNPGNKVTVVISSLMLPSSENCTESYVEVRSYNETGEILGRVCGPEVKEFKAEALWVKLRFIKPTVEDANMDELLNEEEGGEPAEYRLRFRYTHISGGVQVKPGIIQQPMVVSTQSVEYKIIGEPDKAILIHFDEVNFPVYTPADNIFMPAGLYFMQVDAHYFAMIKRMRDLLNSESKHIVTGFSPPKELYLPYSYAIIYAVGLHDKQVGFKLRWEIVNMRENTNTNTTTAPEKVYSCGGDLNPTWEWQSIRNPSIGNNNGYEPDLHCLWKITRPILHGIEMRIVKMDLEDVNGCAYDFVSIIAEEDNELEDEEQLLEVSHKLCRRDQENSTYSFNYNRKMNIHFVSDRSRSGSGFEIQYKLSCHSFEFIRKDSGYFSQLLVSPGYPNTAYAEDCSWALVLESSRRIAVTVSNMTLSPKPCKDNFLSINARSLSILSGTKQQSKLCGELEENEPALYNRTIVPHGRLFIRYEDIGQKSPKGFKLLIEEVMEDCSEILHIDESMPNKTFMTPLYPGLLPNSLDCEYIIRAPSGHRVQFTVDPTGFRMDTSDNDTCFCDSCDYLEIRDGATERSPLIGRYCDYIAPSTVTSTGSFLYIKIKTDSYAQSAGFKAVYKMAECGGSVVLNPTKSTLLHSPNWPGFYPLQTECLWTVYSPNSHFIDMTLNHIYISWAVNCTLDRLEVRDGNATDPYLIPPVCNGNRLEKLDYRSSSSKATVAFFANTTIQRASRSFCKDKKCGFELEMKVSNEGCGGIIDDNQGTITAPGYPGQLLPHVHCRWDLRAGIGFRYLLEFEFTDPDRNGFYQQRYDSNTFSKSRGCFIDLGYYNGRYIENRPNVLSHRFFCEKETTQITEADIATLMYSDMSTRDAMVFSDNAAEDQFYVPFRVNYTRVPDKIDNNGCSYKINSNKSIQIGAYNITGAANEARYCHVVIERPPEFSTTVIRIMDYADEQSGFSKDCNDWGSYIEIMSEESDDVRDVSERLCNASFLGKNRNIYRVYLNTELHIHVSTILSLFSEAQGQKFNLTVEFYPCGGVINEQPNSGILMSPGYESGHYYPNQDCLWQLRAPEGQVVYANILDIDVEQHVLCDNDVLIAGEGRDNSVIHRYCNADNQFGNVSDQMAIADRHKTIRTFSRYLTFTWHTDFSHEGRGWKIEYEFQDVGDGCGFTTHSMTGVVHSPNFPKDYSNDEECVWDIQVPVGYHINIKFTHFDIEASEQCINDYLMISEEHSARANEPLGGYYFLFQDEEKKPPMCGIVTPKMYESTSNRVRLNFTTNSRVNAKGFRAEWNAVCGAVYSLSHYAIVSPNYPNNYPNEDAVCMHLIEPNLNPLEAKSVVVLKIQDFDLSPVKVEFGRYPCETDYIEIVDVMSERVVQTVCGGEPEYKEPIAIRGAVGIRFVTNKTFMHGAQKMHRGFKISYAMQKCGGDIEMMTDDEFMMPISSPAFPLEYPHDLDCVWNISTTEDRVFAIKFLKMDIEATPECDMDWVELHEGGTISNTSEIGRYCGEKRDMPQGIIRIMNNQIIIRFVSDRSMAKGGFRLVVTSTLGPKHGCGGKLESKAEWQSLSPPMEGDSYHHNLHCGWTIQGSEKTMIEFKLVSMDTEKLLPLPGAQRTPLCIDELEIYDGYKAFSPMLVDNLCSATVTTLPTFYHSSHRVAHVVFESDSNGGGKGFELQYRSIAPDCGDWFTAKEVKQMLSYEAKPKSDAHEGQTLQRCQWIIQADTQTPIEIQLKDLKFPSPDNDCSDAYVEIRDVGSLARCQHPGCAGHEADKRIIRFCDELPVYNFISNTMAIQITTSAIISEDKHASFTLNYQLLEACNRTIDAEEVKSGRITSPNYPNPYNHNSTCTTIIKAPQDHFILLAFRHFRIENGRPIFFAPNNTRRISFTADSRLTYRILKCDHDLVQVYEKERNNDTKEWCGSTLPKSYFSKGNELSLYFQTDFSITGEGYDASYYTTKYSPITRTYNFAPIRTTSGVFTTIGYPDGYNVSTTQKWTIIPPAGQHCGFEISVLSLAVKTEDLDCGSMDEYLLLEFKGSTDVRLTTQRLRGCSHEAPTRFSVPPGAGREVSFTFKSDDTSKNDGVGARVAWICQISSIPSL